MFNVLSSVKRIVRKFKEPSFIKYNDIERILSENKLENEDDESFIIAKLFHIEFEKSHRWPIEIYLKNNSHKHKPVYLKENFLDNSKEILFQKINKAVDFRDSPTNQQYGNPCWNR